MVSEHIGCTSRDNILFRLLGDNQQYFHCSQLSILPCGPELPLLQRAKQELWQRELGREDDGQPLEATG